MAFQINNIPNAKLRIVIVGIALIYDGLSDLFVVYRVAGAVKAAKQAAEAIDVEAVEEDSEENE